MSSVLVVDADQQWREWMRRVLEAKGHQVAEAGDGYVALALIERNQPRLVILEIYLPKVDGLDIISHLHAQVLPLKILAISANQIDGFDACQTALTLGAHDAITKPFSAENFLQRVEALLSHL